jgi:Fe-S cluster assembly ATP-binding protein
MNTLEVKNLCVSTDGTDIINGLNLKICSGETHVIMGPNGSGKSTLCYALMGHPRYTIRKGDVVINGTSIKSMSPDQRAILGLFLGFQHPIEVAGLALNNFLRTASNAIAKGRDQTAKPQGPLDFYRLLKQVAKSLNYDSAMLARNLNEGFSGGEKKRTEVLQLAVLKPKFALLDEIDSGLDIDALRVVAAGIKSAFKKHEMGLLIITHHPRILNHIKPNFVHVMAQGKIIMSGGHQLAKKLEKEGYSKLLKN